MNYELKSISPASIFWNAVRIFVFIGLVVAIYSFFIAPNSNLHITALWQKIAATSLFTVVYAVVVSIVLLMITLLYNAWVEEFQVRSFFFRVLWPSLIAGLFLGFSYAFIAPGDSGFFMRCIMGLISMGVMALILAASITGLTMVLNALFGQFHGAHVRFEQANE